MREQWAKVANISTNDNEILHIPNPQTIINIKEVCGNGLLKQLENLHKNVTNTRG
jgi:hypothetical protein